jgi:tryptophan synthase alpha chain
VLEEFIRTKISEKPILLMTHLVLGYPTLEAGIGIVETMVAEGVDIIELQIPFSEPLADGPVISRANHLALDGGVTLDRCLACAARMASSVSVPLVAVTYYNPVFRRGLARFARDLSGSGFSGVIVPDLPPEEGADYLEIMHREKISPVLFFSPSTPDSRMQKLASLGGGFVYCVARRGVTGAVTSFSPSVATYLARCREASNLPIAVGFGIGSREDVEFLTGKADIAVVGTSAILAFERSGYQGLRRLLRELTSA